MSRQTEMPIEGVSKTNKDDRKKPIFLFLCITSILGAITSFLLAAWLIDTSRLAKSTGNTIEMQEKKNGDTNSSKTKLLLKKRVISHLQ